MKSNGSFKCPACPGGTRVGDSRSVIKTNTYRRRRKCLRCGERFTTYELLERDLADLSDAKRAMKQMLGALQDGAE